MAILPWTSLNGTFIIKRSDMSTGKQLERQSLTDNWIKILTVSWSEHVLVNLLCARRL